MIDRSYRLNLRLLEVAVCLAVASWAVPAAAAPEGASRSKRFRLHADTEFFGVTHFADATDPAAARVDTTLVGFGIGRPAMLDSGACVGGGLGVCALGVRPTWGLGFGFSFADQRAVVGARFAFTVDGLFFHDQDRSFSLVGGQFVPYFRWIFLPGRTFRPYVEGRLGLGGGSFAERDDDGDVRLNAGVIYPAVGGGGGLHIFIIDAFSLDLGLNLDYIAPHTRARTRIAGNLTVERDWEQSANVVNFAALAGFSVWFD
jgi:hypothetical protein